MKSFYEMKKIIETYGSPATAPSIPTQATLGTTPAKGGANNPTEAQKSAQNANNLIQNKMQAQQNQLNREKEKQEQKQKSEMERKKQDFTKRIKELFRKTFQINL